MTVPNAPVAAGDALAGVGLVIEGAIAEITLQRPAEHNSITAEMHDALHAAFMAAQTTAGVRAIVFAAQGKSFSAGGNFDEILESRGDPARLARLRASGRPMLLAVADCPLPVVVALQGDAVGLGATLMLASDAVVAARAARISDPHVMIGLAAGDGGAVAWPLHVGMLRAKRYLLTGDRITAEDGYRMGLVTDLVDTPEEALPAARALAGRMAALPPLAVQNTKRILNQIFRRRIEDVFDYGLAMEMETFVTDDVGEAIAAMKGRRKPNFEGR